MPKPTGITRAVVFSASSRHRSSSSGSGGGGGILTLRNGDADDGRAIGKKVAAA